MNSVDPTPWYRSPFAWIMGGLLVWGAYLAIGSFIYGGSMAVWRAAIILGCTLFFLLIWLAVLSVRRRKSGPG